MFNSTHLDIILEEEETHENPYAVASGLVEQLRVARQQVLDIEHRLGSIKRKLSADLALQVRRMQPGLNVAIDKTSCKVGYKTKMLQFTPDIEFGVWNVTSHNHRFLREFLKVHRRDTIISTGIGPFASIIVSYFINHYRTLHEDVEGTGILLIDERRGTLSDILSWRDENNVQKRPPLMSRATRRATL